MNGSSPDVAGRDDGVFDFELGFTETYREHLDDHPAVREAACLDAQFPAIMEEVEDGDLFAGRIELPPVGFNVEQGEAVGYYCIEGEIRSEMESLDLSPEYRERVEAMLDFWDGETTNEKVRDAYPEDVAEALPSDNWNGEPGIAFPLYRMAGANLDYETLLDRGIPGMRDLVADRGRAARRAGGETELFAGMETALDALADTCLWYADRARERADRLEADASDDPAADDASAAELRDLAGVLERLTERAPETFREAIQLSWLYTLLSGSRNYGRMDVYLGDFLVDDLEAGRLTEERAAELLASFWELVADRETIFNGRVVVGGRGRPNEASADEFAKLAIETARRVGRGEPQLSLRWYDGMDPEIWDLAMESIGAGTTYPILYNDDVNVAAAAEAFDVDRETAEQYVPFGCGEYIFDHRSFGTPNGVINLLKALEATIHGGVDPTTGEQLGLDLGTLEEYETFDDLWDAYREQVDHYVEALAKQERIEYEVVAEEAPCLYLTMLYDDCMDEREPVFDGGVRHLGGTLETYGNTNVADSLTAIRELVYGDERVSRAELREALASGFEGRADLQALLDAQPKYGNDDPAADEMAARVHEHVCEVTRQQKRETDLDSYLVVLINNEANTIMGRYTGASADGRGAGEPMANGNAPTSGNADSGVTAKLNSLVKLDPTVHAGTVQNMKFSRRTWRQSFGKVEALLETYFANGGTQAMITVVGREELESAMANPEEYQDLYVRVGGFTARFVDLDEDVQREVLERTLH
ncbi:MAG: pyruvate formate lyase family protein [Haloarculaceae archaeon]